MKTIFMLITLIFFSGSVSLAQLNYKVKQLKPDQVPSEVKASFAEKFPDIKLVKWEKHTAKGKRFKGSKYVARFFEDKLPVRSRFSVNGNDLLFGKKDQATSQTGESLCQEKLSEI